MSSTRMERNLDEDEEHIAATVLAGLSTAATVDAGGLGGPRLQKQEATTTTTTTTTTTRKKRQATRSIQRKKKAAKEEEAGGPPKKRCRQQQKVATTAPGTSSNNNIKKKKKKKKEQKATTRSFSSGSSLSAGSADILLSDSVAVAVAAPNAAAGAGMSSLRSIHMLKNNAFGAAPPPTTTIGTGIRALKGNGKPPPMKKTSSQDPPIPSSKKRDQAPEQQTRQHNRRTSTASDGSSSATTTSKAATPSSSTSSGTDGDTSTSVKNSNNNKIRRRSRKKHFNFPVEPQTLQIVSNSRDYVDHSYRDFSKVPASDPQLQHFRNNNIEKMSFSQKVHHILSQQQYQNCISWLPHGRSFRVEYPILFEREICPKYFGHKRYSSFLRQLNNHGFKHVTKGKDRNSYYHECMLRGMPHLCIYMPDPKDARRLIPDPDNELDFYRISSIYPIPGSPAAAAAAAADTAVPRPVAAEDDGKIKSCADSSSAFLSQKVASPSNLAKGFIGDGAKNSWINGGTTRSTAAAASSSLPNTSKSTPTTPSLHLALPSSFSTGGSGVPATPSIPSSSTTTTSSLAAQLYAGIANNPLRLQQAFSQPFSNPTGDGGGGRTSDRRGSDAAAVARNLVTSLNRRMSDAATQNLISSLLSCPLNRSLSLGGVRGHDVNLSLCGGAAAAAPSLPASTAEIATTAASAVAPSSALAASLSSSLPRNLSSSLPRNLSISRSLLADTILALQAKQQQDLQQRAVDNLTQQLQQAASASNNASTNIQAAGPPPPQQKKTPNKSTPVTEWLRLSKRR